MKKIYLFGTSKKTFAVQTIESFEKYMQKIKEVPTFHGSIMIDIKKLKKVERGLYEVDKTVLGIK